MKTEGGAEISTGCAKRALFPTQRIGRREGASNVNVPGLM